MVKLEEGKYYRTRGGQKVGPARDPARDEGSSSAPYWHVPWGIHGDYYYYPDGRSCLDVRSDDIIAEWEEEMSEAEKRGYTKVIITKDTGGWPVGVIAWHDGVDRAWNADRTEYWFHTVGVNCEICKEEEPETPMTKTEESYKTWGEMTPEEKGPILLADHEGRPIEAKSQLGGWFGGSEPGNWEFLPDYKYRVKPAPEEITLYGYAYSWDDREFATGSKPSIYDTHKITYNVVDGEPDCDSVRMTKLEK